MLDPCPLVWPSATGNVHGGSRNPSLPILITARGSMICSADFVALLARVIDNAQHICASLGSRLPWFLSLRSLNGAGSNQSVKGSRQRMLSISTHAGSPAPLPLCYNPARWDLRGSTRYVAFAQRHPSLPLPTRRVVRWFAAPTSWLGCPA